MIDIINCKDLQIENAKIVDIGYEYTFHQYFEDDKSVLLVYLVLPGIKSNTINLEVSGIKLKMTAFFFKEYERMFGSKRILIEGDLKTPVLTNVFTIEYKSGIAKITLIVDDNNNQQIG